MRLPVFALLLALVPLSAALAAGNDEDNPAYGVWMTDGGKSKVHVYECDGKLCSKIIWLRDPLDSDGQPYHDELNQNVALRSREVVGIHVLDGMTQTSRYEWEGQVYNPEDGKTYKAYLALIKPDVLRLKGCLPMGWPCRSKFWKKLDEQPPSAAESETVVATVEEEVVEESADPVADAAPPPAAAPRAEPPSVVARAEPRTLPQEPEQQQMEVATAEAPPPAAPKVITPPQRAQPQRAQPQQAQPQRAQPQQAARADDIPPPPPIPQIGQPARQASPAPQAPSAPPRVASTPQVGQGDRQAAAPSAQQKAPQTPSEAAVSMPPSLPERVAPPPARQPQQQAQPPYGGPGTRYSALSQPSQPTRPARGDDGARYLVQVAARQNEREAMAVFYDLRQRYPELLGQARPIIKRVNLGDLGVWYRVRVGPITGKSAALAFCNRLKFAGSDCFVRRQ